MANCGVMRCGGIPYKIRLTSHGTDTRQTEHLGGSASSGVDDPASTERGPVYTTQLVMDDNETAEIEGWMCRCNGPEQCPLRVL